MSTEKESKLNRLLNSQPPGVVLMSSWLVEQGYSLDLQKRYRKSHWFESIGTGALIRSGDQVDYLGGVYALQTQFSSFIHPAGKTALSLQGKAQYLEFSTKKTQLFGGRGENLPQWFRKYDWGVEIDYYKTSFLPPGLGLIKLERKTFSLMVSSPARAIMECLYLAPKYQTLMEAYELMEGLNNLRPALVQKLLEQCSSIKVKRLFLYLADKAGHEWVNHLDRDRVDLGSGKRSIVEGGIYNSKYQITVPKELEADHG